MTYRIAIGTNDGINITEHFGQCSRFQILAISQEDDSVTFMEDRITIHQDSCKNHQEEVIREKINALRDCQIVLVRQVGTRSEKLLIHSGIVPLQYQGSINQALIKIKAFYKKHQFL
ncbi:NifB/NifX family molybdenum-iron cluster-binding protein [Anaerocolumna xylanovorans]|uniref:Dinitrogenase iron-molybdenum cofactor n=1 Tax=Anaerocolumna xylanovorans DSM 12503 TaxID=1121345 RepID=A0A1M7Y2N1_9FIRM|nr:NifB/NifX family molybdenum-iron cluster-binding protein [Anaerocolumna xylanovorans]SHO45974.1 Dinitrogenase iron-molybdenum cofactor [Anaerocolumna xylanovorans DSM 12503]